MSNSVNLYFYYPLKDRLAVDLFRDSLITQYPFLECGPLVDYLINDHPLPQFEIICPEEHIELIALHLEPVSEQFSIRIDLTPVKWMGRQL